MVSYYLAERALKTPTTDRKKFVDKWFAAELRYVNYGVHGPLRGMHATLDHNYTSSVTDVKWAVANVLRMRRQRKFVPVEVR